MSVSRPKTVMNHGMPGGGSWPAGVVRAAHPQRREVGDRLARTARSRSSQLGAELRHAQLPGRERLADAGELVAEAPLGQRGRDARRRRATATTSTRSSQRSRGASSIA